MERGNHLEPIIFRYRARDLTARDISFIQEIIRRHYGRGRSHISRVLCEQWQWMQPNGHPKDYAARDLLLRLEENGYIQLPKRIFEKNNVKKQRFDQIPLFIRKHLGGTISDYQKPVVHAVRGTDAYLWDFLVHHYHYLGLPTLVGKYLKQIVTIDGQPVACIGWASAAWKIKDRDDFIGWDETTRRQQLHLVANNVRFLIPDWIHIRHLASKVLALSLACINDHWQAAYGHRLYLAETFVDVSRYKGACYRAANWRHVGQTAGSSKKGNAYHYHGQPKAIYLYPLHRHFKRMLCHDPG